MSQQTGQIGPQLDGRGTGGAGAGTRRSTKETRIANKVVTPRTSSRYNEAENAGLLYRNEEDHTELLPKL